MDSSLAEVQIRYDGLDAERHQIELGLLGQSMQGVARILAVSGHFVVTQQYAKQMQALDVKVYVTEPKANCFSMTAVLAFASQHQLFSGGGGVLLGILFQWIISRASNNREEMKALKDSLDKAITLLAGQQTEIVSKLTATVERMAESLRPAVVAAVAPVGKSCTQMRIGESQIIDQATADAIRAERADEVTEERYWSIRLTELDLESGTAKVRLADHIDSDDKRIKAIITDPVLAVAGNPYVRAFADGLELKVKGKATLREGEIQAIYFSDST